MELPESPPTQRGGGEQVMDQGAAGVGVAPSLALAQMFVKKKNDPKKKAGPLSQAGSCVHEIRSTKRRSDGADADDERDEGKERGRLHRKVEGFGDRDPGQGVVWIGREGSARGENVPPCPPPRRPPADAPARAGGDRVGGARRGAGCPPSSRGRPRGCHLRRGVLLVHGAPL